MIPTRFSAATATIPASRPAASRTSRHLISGSVAVLTFSLIHGQRSGWGSAREVLALGVTVAMVVALIVRERRADDPLVDLRLLARPRFTAANTAGLAVFFAFGGAIVYFSAYFQQVQYRSPVAAGLDISSVGIAFALAAPGSGKLVGRVGALIPTATGLALAASAMFLLVDLGPATGIGDLAWKLALLDAGIGLSLTPMTSTAVAAVDAARVGMASAVHNALSQLGQVLGVAVLGAVVHAPIGSEHAGALPAALRAGFVEGLRHALAVSGIALLVAAVLVVVHFRLGGRTGLRTVHDQRASA